MLLRQCRSQRGQKQTANEWPVPTEHALDRPSKWQGSALKIIHQEAWLQDRERHARALQLLLDDRLAIDGRHILAAFGA